LLATCGVFLTGWQNNEVGIAASDVGQYGAGTIWDPIVVIRDNPEVQGWFDWSAGNSAWADGTYSHAFAWGGGADGFLRTYEYRGTGEAVDDWWAPLRAYAGYWSLVCDCAAPTWGAAQIFQPQTSRRRFWPVFSLTSQFRSRSDLAKVG
jgi:hypothetical protein